MSTLFFDSLQGKRLFGALRQMLTAKVVTQRFHSLSAQVSTAIESLQLALQTMDFLKLDDVMAQLDQLATAADMAKAIADAHHADVQSLPACIKQQVAVDAEFKQALLSNLEEVKALLGNEFSELRSYLEGEFKQLHMEVAGIRREVLDQSAAVMQHVSLEVARVKEIAWCEVEMGERLGGGSFGDVYRGRWGGLDVAVKKLKITDTLPRLTKSKMLAEAKAINSVTSAYVVYLYGVVFEGANNALIMQYWGPDVRKAVGADECALTFKAVALFPR